jgi:HEAT repeat protein
MSADREKFLASNPRAVAEITQVFEESAGQDARTRRYLALVLGLLDDRQAVPALRRGLADSDPDTVKNCLWALARLGDTGSSLTMIELTHHDDASVRLMALYALGVTETVDPQTRAVLAAALNDPDELVKWNAAFALANKGDAAGRGMLLRLLDKEYVDRFPQATPQNRQRYRIAAVNALVKLDGPAALPLLEKVGKEDADLQVRNAAIQQLHELKQK